MELLDQEYQMVPIAKMKPHPSNPNVGDEEALAASIDASGFYGACIVRVHPDEEDAFQILAGEHRWKLAARRGVTEMPVIVLADVDEVTAIRILLDDNEVTRRGTYDRDALDRALETLGDLGGHSVFDSVLQVAGQAVDDEAAAAAAEAEAAEGEPIDDADFEREYGILLLADSEMEQQELYEDLAKTYGASKLRVVSV